MFLMNSLLTILKTRLNYSSYFIKFDHLQLFEYNISQNIISILINKLRLGGSLVIGLFDIKLLSKLYSDNVIDDTKFLSNIKDIRSIWSIDQFNVHLSSNHKDTEITKIQTDTQQHIIYITLERKSI